MMKYRIFMGVPEMKEFWESLKGRIAEDKASKNEKKLYRQIGKTLFLLSQDPRHPGLRSHEIAPLTARYGLKVWESYLENNTPNAGTAFLGVRSFTGGYYGDWS